MVLLYCARQMRLEKFVFRAQPLVDHTGASREKLHTLSSEWCWCCVCVCVCVYVCVCLCLCVYCVCVCVFVGSNRQA